MPRWDRSNPYEGPDADDPRLRDDDRDDARADDFRCHGCETPLARPLSGRRFCAACRAERGWDRDDD